MILLDPLARPVIAHRGASGEWPENTMLAFAKGLEQGADALECDVRLSADGVPVVIHDATLDRTTSGAGPVGACRLDALRRLDAGRGERVPTLAEVLDGFPRTPVIVEIKETAAAVPARRVVDQQRAGPRVLAGSFHHAALRPFRAGATRSGSRREVGLFWAAAHARLPFFRVGYQAFTVPEVTGPVTVVDAPFVRRASRLGLPVHVWPVDDVRQAARLRSRGVAGIITNFPGRFQPS